MDSRRVIVVGAGLAGLSSALALTEAGFDVTVVEARPRPGGRVWTVREGFAHGQHAELGGEFVDSDHRRLRRLVKRFGLRLVPVLQGGFVQRLHPAGGRPALHRTGGWDLLAQALDPLVKQYQRAQEEEHSTAAREMSTYSLREWLRRQHAGADVHAAADALRGFFVAEPDDLSVLQVVQQIASGGSPIRTKMFRIVGGNDRLIDAMIAATPATWLYGHVVRRVEQSAGGVTVTMDDASARRTQLTADLVVLTVPTTRLRLIEFAPALPEQQQHAIASLHYGCATKAIVQRSAASVARRRARAFATDGPAGAFWDSTEGQPSSTHSMLTFLGGGRASASLRELARAGAPALVGATCWLGDASVDRAAHHVWVSWEDEDYTRGGYAYLDPAYDPAWRRLLSRRAGRVLFAGEHTSTDWQGYMEGAVQSGFEAAHKIKAQAA